MVAYEETGEGIWEIIKGILHAGRTGASWRMWDFSAHEWLGQCPRAHLLCRVIIVRLPRLVEVQHGVGAQADGADAWVVQWPVLVGLGSGHQGWTGQESVPPHPLGFKGASPAGDREMNACLGMWLLNESRGGSTRCPAP